MSDVEVRPALPEEYDAVGELTVRAYAASGFLHDGDEYAGVLRNARDRAAAAELYTAVLADEVVGTVTFCPPGGRYSELARAGEGEFRMLAVAPEVRGRGVGRALVGHCFERCRTLGLGALVLCSLPRMTSAHALYVSMGFARDPSLDWKPVPHVVLLGFRADVPATVGERTRQ